jgi:UDP-glucose:(heptosyl)LPS alpha-1,3-glucosyltransferase
MTSPVASRAGGIERVVVECANQLVAAGPDVHVLATRFQADALDERVTRVHVPTRRRPDALSCLQYRDRAGHLLEQVGGVHGSFSGFSPLGGVFWIPSVHRTAYELVLRSRSRAAGLPQRANPFHRLRLAVESRIYAPGGYRHLIAASEELKGEAVERYGVTAEDVTVLPLGYDAELFDPARRPELRERTRSALGYGDGERVVLFVANELERKGFDALLEGAGRLQDPALRLLVAGDVDLGSRRQGIDRSGVPVQAVGPSDDLPALHAAADAFALPTRYEPWGLVIVEALASGLPVLTSRLAGAAVAVEPGRTGELLDDPEDADEVAARLRDVLALVPGPEVGATVRHLSWVEVARRYAEILAR